MRTCTICQKHFSRPYSLRRHYKRFHPMDSAPKLERQSRKCGHDAENIHQFGGNIHESSDDESDLSDANSMVNNVGSKRETD